ncbi:unnamed protein product [Lampetra planeri]
MLQQDDIRGHDGTGHTEGHGAVPARGPWPSEARALPIPIPCRPRGSHRSPPRPLSWSPPRSPFALLQPPSRGDEDDEGGDDDDDDEEDEDAGRGGGASPLHSR